MIYFGLDTSIMKPLTQYIHLTWWKSFFGPNLHTTFSMWFLPWQTPLNDDIFLNIWWNDSFCVWFPRNKGGSSYPSVPHRGKWTNVYEVKIWMKGMDKEPVQCFLYLCVLDYLVRRMKLYFSDPISRHLQPWQLHETRGYGESPF
jgi:hypothetical protein